MSRPCAFSVNLTSRFTKDRVKTPDSIFFHRCLILALLAANMSVVPLRNDTCVSMCVIPLSLVCPGAVAAKAVDEVVPVVSYRTPADVAADRKTTANN